MRFEYLVGLLQLLFFVSTLVYKRSNRKLIIIAFLLSLYGPLYSLVSFPVTPKLPLSFIISILLILLTWNNDNFNKKSFYFILLFFFIILVQLFLGRIVFNNLPKLILIFSVILAAYSVSYFLSYLYSPKQHDFFIYLGIYMGIGGVLAIVTRLSYGTTIRDAGYGLFHIFLFIYFINNYLKEKRISVLFNALLLIIYIFLIQTRSLVVLSIVFTILYFFSGYNIKNLLRLIPVILIGLLWIFLLLNARNDGSVVSESLQEDPSMIMRLNAMNTELEAFVSNPIFGKGLLFTDELALNEILNVRDGAFVEGLDYSAFNHIGISSILGQVGLFGFFLLICYPVVLAFNSRKKVRFDFLYKGLGILVFVYFLSYFISGSPIRSDFQDLFWYYFASFMLIIRSSRFNTSIHRNFVSK